MCDAIHDGLQTSEISGVPYLDNFIIRERNDVAILVIYNYFADSGNMSIETSCWLRKDVRIPQSDDLVSASCNEEARTS